MNLEELKASIDSEIENLQGNELKDISVLITLTENSMGARASSEIQSINMGFDWEHGQLRIHPSKCLVKKGNSSKDIKNAICREYDGRKYYICPRCETKVSKHDNYCRGCCQKLK